MDGWTDSRRDLFFTPPPYGAGIFGTWNITFVLFSANITLYSSTMSSSRLDSSTTRCFSPQVLLLLLVLVSVVMATKSSEDDDPFNPSEYCYNVCSQGRGGNVCQCSATKFAGKRSRIPLMSSEFDGSLTPSGGSWATHRHVISRLHANRQNIRHQARLTMARQYCPTIWHHRNRWQFSANWINCLKQIRGSYCYTAHWAIIVYSCFENIQT